jgi:O-acetyl-ADP-ribose deacetylase
LLNSISKNFNIQSTSAYNSQFKQRMAITFGALALSSFSAFLLARAKKTSTNDPITKNIKKLSPGSLRNIERGGLVLSSFSSLYSLFHLFKSKNKIEKSIFLTFHLLSLLTLNGIIPSSAEDRNRTLGPSKIVKGKGRTLTPATISSGNLMEEDSSVTNLHQGVLGDNFPFDARLSPPEGKLTKGATKGAIAEFSYRGATIQFKDLGEHGFDLFTEDTEALVNAANTGMIGGGGVDGKFNALNKETGLSTERTKLSKLYLRSIQTGGAFATGPYNFSRKGFEISPSLNVNGRVITKGGFTPGTVKNIIHAIGPSGPANAEKDFRLAMAYKNACILAHRLNLKSIAFPVLGIGIFNYPVKNAANAIIRGIQEFLEESSGRTTLLDIRVCGLQDLFIERANLGYKAYEEL